MIMTRLSFMASVLLAFAGPVLAKPPATLTTLHSFKGNPSDGLNPDAKLLYHGGLLYGTTSAGGVNDEGAVFGINPATGAESFLYSLASNAGSGPRAGLINLRGKLYGTAEAGGGSWGSVFAVNPATGGGNSIYDFDSPPDGVFPDGELLSVNSDLSNAIRWGAGLRWRHIQDCSQDRGGDDTIQFSGRARQKAPLWGFDI